MTGDLKCPACEVFHIDPCGPNADEKRVCTGRPGCVQKGGVEPGVDTPATSGADIVERLRGTWIWSNGRDERLRNEAADEIGRLRAEVERVTKQGETWMRLVNGMTADRAALAQRVAEAVREACAKEVGTGTPPHVRINAINIDAIVAKALKREGG
jgi:hypothetical protein